MREDTTVFFSENFAMWDEMEQNGTPDTVDLDASQLRALEALAAGSTVTAAAEHAEVGRTTLYRWLRDPRFVVYLNRAKQDQLTLVHCGLRSLAADAVQVLHEGLTGSTLLQVRLNVAMKILRAVGADRPEPVEGGNRVDAQGPS